MARLREALRDAPAAQRIVIHTDHLPPLAGPVGPRERRFSASRAFETFGEGRVGVVTISMTDTVKEVADGRVRRTVPRDTLVQVTGPWMFDREALTDALGRVGGREAQVGDMIDLCEVAQLRVRVVPGQ